jgi:uncharacterized membrane protein YgcG
MRRSPRSQFIGMASCLALLATDALGSERILSYHSDIAVKADSTLEVRETLQVQAEGEQIRHGIYRDFPTEYTDMEGRRVVVGFRVEAALRDGQSESFRIERLANGKRIYLGDAQLNLARGEHTYVLVYRTDRQVGFFPSQDELYWNVTGNGWAFPIEIASADVTLPEGVPSDDIRGEAYTGRPGARHQDYQTSVENGVARFTTTRRLGVGEGLTIVTMWPTGHVKQPTRLMQAQYLFRDEQPLFLGWGGLALLSGYYLVVWFRVGRDPPRGIVVPLYEPPDSLSPAVMRYLLRMRYDDRCFAAAILSLAVKGYLTIAQGQPYKLTRSSKAASADLSRDEKVTLEGLFRGSNSIDLTPQNHEIVRAAKSAHRKCIRVLHMPGFFQINGGWHVLGILTSLLVATGVFLLHPRGDFGPSWFLLNPAGHATLAAVALGFVANGIFGKLLFAPTRKGRALMDRIEGFKLYLGLAEGPDLKRIAAPPATTQLYERYLPAALALGVEQRWAERFAAVFSMQAASSTPSWYNGSDWDPHDVGSFEKSLASSLDSAVSSASSAPGSSSGSDGGGSSGGGGGGGGGGGW